MATASNEFKLIGPRAEFKDSAVTLSCRLSPEISAVDLEIRWFKETDCVCVYKNSKVTEGRGYKGRVSLFTQELERGNVSLQLRNCIESDRGHYLCQVTDGDRTEEITVEMNPPELFGRLMMRLKDVCVYQRDRKWTEDERKKMEKSVLLTASSEEDELSDLLSKTEISGDLGIQTLMEVFIPELVENYAGNKNKDEYRFICHHAGQFMCKLTNLVFEMDGKGEVLYRIVSWDSSYLDGLGQLQPAGPLYSIACHEGSIRHLHLPHCEICTDEVKLSTAHVTGGNVELIQPLKVTNTHVIIDIQGLSLFGLLKCISLKYPVKAQVILFYKKKNGDSGMSKLHMHLLPGNVPVEEVHKRHRSMTYIETSSNCELTSGKKYRPCCKDTDHEYVLQPRIVKFECDYGPNYHPTFEMLCKTEVDKVTVGLLDKNKQEVWEPRLVLLAGADFMDRHMDQLIQRVSSVMEIADCLKSKMMISDEKYNKIHAASTSCEQMRLLYSSLNAGGRVVKAEAYKVLKEKEPHLVDELNRSSQF